MRAWIACAWVTLLAACSAEEGKEQPKVVSEEIDCDAVRAKMISEAEERAAAAWKPAQTTEMAREQRRTERLTASEQELADLQGGIAPLPETEAKEHEERCRSLIEKELEIIRYRREIEKNSLPSE